MILNAILLTTFAGLSTLIGSCVVFFIKKPKDSIFNFAMGFSAGVMIFVALTEMLNQSINIIGYRNAFLSFFIGILIIYLIDRLIPHCYEDEATCDHRNKKYQLKKCGTLIAIGIAIHNFPEGIAVFFSSLTNIKLGIAIALAIALHNIPEGIAVAMPIYYATKSKRTAFLYSFLSGIAEPVAAVISYFFLYNYINETVLNIILAGVAGIMVFISFDELLPQAYKHEDVHKIILGIILGMAVMALSMYYLL